jgi:alkylation response protein AidB-like acyl-CoA dehydrogenase
MIDLAPDPEQQKIVDSVASFLADRCPVGRLRSRAAPAGAAERREWKHFAALGWFGIALPEASGGSGLTVAEEVLVFRELGRFVMSPTLLATSLAAHAAALAGLNTLVEALLSGAERCALALPTGAVSLSARAAWGELHLVDAEAVDLLILWTEAGVALFRRGDLGSPVRRESMDDGITLERAMAGDARPLAFIAAGDAPLRLRAELLIAAQLVGMAEAARDIAADHARTRQQFGKPIGAFQAVAHHCADMSVRAAAASVQTRFAALAARAARDDAVFQVAAASLLAGEAAFRNATLGIRVLGGMGYTADCPLHHYLKRAILLRRAAGGAHPHRTRLLADASIQ